MLTFPSGRGLRRKRRLAARAGRDAAHVGRALSPSRGVHSPGGDGAGRAAAEAARGGGACGAR